MDLLIGIIIGLCVLVFLIVIHEIGHGITARRNGVKVEELGIGFPPFAWGKKLKKSFLGPNVMFSLNWLPIGGFVRLKGEYDSSTEKGSYGAANYWVKTKILLAGVLMNWLMAVLLFTILALVGLPKIIDSQFTVASDTRITTEGSTKVTTAQVAPNSPADKAGIKVNDQLVSVAGVKMDDATTLLETTKQHAGESVEVAYVRDGQQKSVDVKLRNGGEEGYLGVGASGGVRETIHATWSAPIVGVVTTAQLTDQTVRGLGSLLKNLVVGLYDQTSADEATRKQGAASVEAAGNGVTGPIGILGVIFPEASKVGITPVVMIAAIISLSLAVMNMLPIPGLDGGRWFVMTLYRLRGKKLTKDKEESIQAAGMLTLFGLIILITVLDIGKVL